MLEAPSYWQMQLPRLKILSDNGMMMVSSSSMNCSIFKMSFTVISGAVAGHYFFKEHGLGWKLTPLGTVGMWGASFGISQIHVMLYQLVCSYM